ncbi:MAG: ABC transporter ATP-binding protein [Atopobiaceae bacterium]|nr:ABC transporter ATP-binding protein [Atopobiaceae bacterium]
MPYLSCLDLSVGYAGKPVAEGISFSVGAGEMLAVVGENGSGKSTLMRTLLGLMPALAGTVSLGAGIGTGEVGYLPQSDETQRDFPASAWEIALSGRTARLGRRPFFSKEDRDAATKALARTGALELADKAFSKLSGGQQQRVLLARAMASEPRLLVLDEPTTGLDPEASEALYLQIDRLRADGVGVIAVTHDVAGALPHATTVLTIADGHAVLAEGREAR